MSRKPEIGNVKLHPNRPLRRQDRNGYVLKFYCPIRKKRIRRNCGTRDGREARRIQRECRDRLSNGKYVASGGAIRYSDTSRITGLNPLFVESRGVSEVTYRARIASRVGHVSKILLHAFGEKDFNGKPVMFKFFNYYLMTLALTGLTIPDVRHFFDTASPVYQALTEAAPDFIAQLELEQLATLRPMDREELIGSTKNRFLNFLRNPIVELGLSKPDGHVDLTRAIRERSIIIVNLDRGGVLRDEDVEIFANLWLHEVLYAVYNTPRGERVPHFLMIDELPTFRSSFDVITSALAQVRKFLCRFVVAFQGTQLFDDRERDRLLNALVGAYRPNRGARYRPPRAASR